MDDLQEIVVCPAMGLDHLPDRCQNVFENTRTLIRDGNKDVSGFFTKSLTAEMAEKERRAWKPTWFCSPTIHVNDSRHHHVSKDEDNNNNKNKTGITTNYGSTG
jgi:hypothetical protein